MNKEVIPQEIWKKASLIVGCSHCNFYVYVEKGGKYEKEERENLRELAEKGMLECPICKAKMNVLIDVEA